MSRRVSRVEAHTHLEAYTREALGDADKISPRMMARAVRAAEARLNRGARRALGARSDGRFHPLAARKDVVRTRNA